MGTRKWKYACAGALLSAGAPLGWLLLRALRFGSRLDLAEELLWHASLYLYLSLATAIAFVSFGAVLGSFADRLAKTNAQLSELAVSDALTGLKNGRYFHARLAEECSRFGRERRPLALLMADLDHFKLVNDRFGHPIGDEVLAQFAAILRAGVRAADSACRIGGEEFAIICPATSVEDARALAERLRESVAIGPLKTSAGEVGITLSVGVAVLSEGSASELMRAADAALYEAKRAGRNRVEVSAPMARVA